jgi:hypothetical protein
VKFKAEIKAIIVSSFGAVPNCTIRKLNRIINVKCRSVLELWIKRMVIAALKGSFRL